MDIKIGDLTIDVRPIWLGGLMDPTWIRLIMVPRLNQVQQTFIVCSWHCGNPGRWDPRKVEKVHAKTHFVFAYFDKNHNFDPDESREMSKRMARAISPGDIRQVKPKIRARFPAHFVDVPYDRIARGFWV